MHSEKDWNSKPDNYRQPMPRFKAGDSVLLFAEQQGGKPIGFGFGQRKVIGAPRYRNGQKGWAWYYTVSAAPAFVFAEEELIFASGISPYLPRNARRLLQRTFDGKAELPRAFFDGTLPSEDIAKLEADEKLLVSLHSGSNKHSPNENGDLVEGRVVSDWDSYWFKVALADNPDQFKLVPIALHRLVTPMPRERLYNFLCAKALELRAALVISQASLEVRVFVVEGDYKGYTLWHLDFAGGGWYAMPDPQTFSENNRLPSRYQVAVDEALQLGLYEKVVYTLPNLPYKHTQINLTRLGLFVLQALKNQAAQPD